MQAEVSLARPGFLPALGPKRDAVLELRADAEAALADADERLRAAAGDRLQAADRIRACNRALNGTGEAVDPTTGRVVRYGLRRSDAFPDPLPDATTLDVVDGDELRQVLVELLRALERPATVAELVRLLAAHGMRPPGRASQAVSNALRVEMRWATVDRVARGTYAAADSSTRPPNFIR